MRYFVSAIICILTSSAFGQSVDIFSEKWISFPAEKLDSITYTSSDLGLYQNFWIEGESTSQLINENDSITFDSESISFGTFEAPEYGVINGIMTNKGYYGMVLKENEESSNHYIILGNIERFQPDLAVKLDSLNLIRLVTDGSSCFKYSYFKDDFSIEEIDANHNIVSTKNYPYSILDNIFFTDNRSRVSALTQNNWYKALSLTNLAVGLRNPTTNSLMTNFLQCSGNGLLESVGDVAGLFLSEFNPLQALELFAKYADKLMEFVYYRGASVETLGSDIINATSANVSAKMNNISNIPMPLDDEEIIWMTLKVRVWSGIDYYGSEKKVHDDAPQIFRFSNLNPETYYEYRAEGQLSWIEVIGSADICVGDALTGNFSSIVMPGVTTVKCDQYLIGETKSFTTPSLNASINEIVNITKNSAIVKYSFTNAEEFECGLDIESNHKILRYSVSPTSSETTISGLEANTTYYCRPFIIVNGEERYFDGRSFITEPEEIPDLSGVWTFNQSFLGSSTVYPELVLSSSNRTSATYTASGFYGVISFSMTVSSDRTASIVLSSPYGTKGYFSGKFNEEFTSISGDSYIYDFGPNNWAVPPAEYEEPWSLTR